jgi:uncharacterized protein YndB with AHSA1/START domain
MTPSNPRKAGKTAGTQPAASRDFVIDRVLDAPRDLVWQAFTDPERLKNWWGPKGFTVISSKMDLRPGGIYHYGLKSPTGAEMWGKFVFRKIVEKERMEFVISFSDRDGGTTRHPLHMQWPLEMLSSYTFEDEPGGKTRVTVRSAAWNATEAERKTFDDGHDSMRMGWGGTFEQLAAYLATAGKGGRS